MIRGLPGREGVDMTVTVQVLCPPCRVSGYPEASVVRGVESSPKP